MIKCEVATLYGQFGAVYGEASPFKRESSKHSPCLQGYRSRNIVWDAEHLPRSK